MNIVLPKRMTVDEFLAWAARQEKGRYELFKGRVVMQQPQTWRHAELRVPCLQSSCGRDRARGRALFCRA
jgi:hypothetical protein